MAQIAGIRVTDSDAWWIVDQLRTVGRADDATAAFALERGIIDDEPVDWLTPNQQQAIMLVLSKAPESLVPLRRKLARDHLRRSS